MKKLLTLILFMALIPIMVNAQKVSIDNIGKAWLNNSGPIIKNNEVQGYYFFYRLDEKSKKTRVYLLDIYDENLESVAKKRITGSKYLYLLESAFDGENIMFKFYDGKEGRFSFRVYNQEAEFVTKKDRELDSRYNLVTIDGDDAQSNQGLFAIPNKGFINYSLVKNKRLGYKIEFFNNTIGKKGWTIGSDKEVKQLYTARFMTANEDLILSSIIEQPKAMSAFNTYYLSGIDVNTGKEKIKLLMDSKKYDVELLNADINEETGEILVFGEYYEKGVKTIKEPSLGLFTYTVSPEGKIIERKYVSWTRDVAKFLPVTESGKLDGESGKGYIWFHKVIRTQDGKIFAIGEQFRKSVSAGAVGLKILAAAANTAAGGNVASANVSAMKIVVEDMMIFQFSEDFELEDVITIDKGKENFALPEGSGLINTHRLAMMIDNMGGFDYSFSQIRDDGANFSSIFIDYKKEKGEKGELRMGAASYQDGEIVETYMPLDKKKSTTFRIYPGKPGYIIITEYLRKEKTVETRLEKINF